MISEDEFITVALIQCDYVLLEKGNLDTEIDAHTAANVIFIKYLNIVKPEKD